MLYYTNEQLATVISVPIVTTLLCWTTIIFHKNRKYWGPYDIPIITILILSIIRNLIIFIYIILIIFNEKLFTTTTTNFDLCNLIVWFFNSIHTFQSSILTTLAIIGLFSIKLIRKQENLKQYLTKTHIIYHLFCLTILCACVGIAAILAQNNTNDTNGKFEFYLIKTNNPCKFMPFDLDIKFNVFIIVLNIFLSFISLISFFIICYNYYKIKLIQLHQNDVDDNNSFDYIKKSNSDLSDLSMTATTTTHHNNYYDTYTIHRNNNNNNNNCIGGDYYEISTTQQQQQQPHLQHHNCNNWNHHQHQQTNNNNNNWNCDLSNLSTTVSSTNSRRPCLGINNHQQQQKQIDFDNNNYNTTTTTSSGLETIHPILIVCYLFYHLPLIILCIYPKIVAPWPIAGLALWLGLIQDLLIPIGLSLVDSRFSKWVSNVYKCNDKHNGDKLPTGLDGKFRPFSSQPQSLEIIQTNQQQQQQQQRGLLQAVEHRFPITNGSLYTSIDGRLPVIHNYRRHKELRGTRPEVQQTVNKRNQDNNNQFHCGNCQSDFSPSHSNLHHLSPHYINKQLNLIQQQSSTDNKSLNNLITNRDLIGLNAEMGNINNNANRLCKSETNLRGYQQERITNPQIIHKSTDYSSSDDDGTTTNVNNNNNNNTSHSFDSLSSQSSYSITTEANGDFEFYQTDNINRSQTNSNNFQPIQSNNFKITRSNSKRSLENFQAFIEQNEQFLFNDNNNICKLFRSNSYMTLEDRYKSKKLLRSDSKLSDCTTNFKQKIKSVEYLPTSNASTVFIEDFCYFNYPKCCNNNDDDDDNIKNYVGSVPDFKKVFISEYI